MGAAAFDERPVSAADNRVVLKDSPQRKQPLQFLIGMPIAA